MFNYPKSKVPRNGGNPFEFNPLQGWNSKRHSLENRYGRFTLGLVIPFNLNRGEQALMKDGGCKQGQAVPLPSLTMGAIGAGRRTYERNLGERRAAAH